MRALAAEIAVDLKDRGVPLSNASLSMVASIQKAQRSKEEREREKLEQRRRLGLEKGGKRGALAGRSAAGTMERQILAAAEHRDDDDVGGLGMRSAVRKEIISSSGGGDDDADAGGEAE